MQLGVHLPIADLGDGTPTGAELRAYVRAARDLGFATISANDHLLWRRPWLDGPTTLASVAGEAGTMAVATSILVPVLRHPVVVAKMLTTLGSILEGPLIAGLGPGSSRADHEAVDLSFDERWARFDEALPLIRALVRGEEAAPGTFYRGAPPLAPLPNRPPQVWFGSWGSDRRLAAMAAIADGWFASAYNAPPDRYAEARARLDEHLRAAGRDPAAFPDALATTWVFVTEDRELARHVVEDVLAPALGREPASLAHLPIGDPDHCARSLAAYAAAGVRQLLLWPVRDAPTQLERCAELRPAL